MGSKRNRDEGQAEPQLDQAQAVAPVEDRVPCDVLAWGSGCNTTSEGGASP